MTKRYAALSMLQNGINLKIFWLYCFPYVTDKPVTSNHIHSCPFFKHDNQRFKEAFIPFARFTRDQFRARQLPWDISTVSSVCKTKSGRGEGRESVASVTPVGPERQKSADT